MRVDIEICGHCKAAIPDENEVVHAQMQPLVCQISCATCGRTVSSLWYLRCKVRNPRPRHTNDQRRMELLAAIRDRVPLVGSNS